MLTTMFRGEMRNINSLRNPYFELYKYCHIGLINPATYNIINQIFLLRGLGVFCYDETLSTFTSGSFDGVSFGA